MTLSLSRPLVIFDLEATGIDVANDRIVEISVVKLMPDGQEIAKRRLLNPGIAIPPSSTAVHGITDADVADAPMFQQIARSLYDFFDGCDLGGFNVIYFDVPMLIQEFRRCGITFSIVDRHLVDAQRIFHKREPRTLSAALRLYCGLEHTNAHSSAADVAATIQVLKAQLERYDDLPRTPAALDQYCHPRSDENVDRRGKLKWINNDVGMAVGEFAGTTLRDLVEHEPQYLHSILQRKFSPEVKSIVQAALNGEFMTRPGAEPTS